MRKSTGRQALGMLLAVLLAGISALAIPAAADPGDRLDEIRRKQDKLDRKIDRANEQRGHLLDRIGVVDSARAKVESEVNDLDAELATLTGRIDEVSTRLSATQQKLAVLHTELEDILGRLVSRTDIFTERAIAAYKAGPTAYIDGIFSADSFGDVMQRYAYYESVLDSDAELIDEIEVLRAETDARRDEVEAKEEQIAADKARLEADRARVAAIRAERADALASLKDVLSEKRTLLGDVEAKKSRWQRIQDQLDRESAEIQSLLAGGTSTSPAPSYGGGQFAWPAPGPVTSPYGWRTHPIFGDRRLHTGVDIGAPYGATVVAGEGGIVAYVGVMSGYGNVVVIDHGGGIATTYNHLSGFAVSSGQTVSRSQPVASVGCTGYCTGPHLHFEVRVNGSPVDPMPYLQ